MNSFGTKSVSPLFQVTVCCKEIKRGIRSLCSNIDQSPETSTKKTLTEKNRVPVRIPIVSAYLKKENEIGVKCRRRCKQQFADIRKINRDLVHLCQILDC